MVCPRCGSEMAVVAFIDPRAPSRSDGRGEVIERILRHGGLWRGSAPRPPPDVAGVVHALSRLLRGQPAGKTHLRGHGHLRGHLLILTDTRPARRRCAPGTRSTRNLRPDRSPTSPRNLEKAAGGQVAEAVLDFFQRRVLAAARPEDQEGGLGIYATIREAVDAAEPEIAQAFTNQPLVEALIRNTLGQTYWFLGEPESAVPQHERACDLLRGQLGPDHPDTLAAQNDLGLACEAAGQPDEALPLLEKTLQAMKVSRGRYHPHTLRTTVNLAEVYRDIGRLAEALSIYEKTLQWMKQTNGPDHPDTLVMMNNLANVYTLAGRVDDAIALHEQTQKLLTRQLGPSHPDTLTSMCSLAEAYCSAGRFIEALSLQKQVLELHMEKLGPDHPHTLQLMEDLARVYLSVGQPDQAVAVYREYISAQRKRMPADDPQFARLLMKVALSLMHHHQPLHAETYLRECLSIRERTMADHWMLINAQSLLGETRTEQGRAPHAVEAARQKFTEAERLLIAGYEGMKQRGGSIPVAARVGLFQAPQRLVTLYTVWDKPEQAAEWQKRLAEATPAAQPPPKTPDP